MTAFSCFARGGRLLLPVPSPPTQPRSGFGSRARIASSIHPASDDRLLGHGVLRESSASGCWNLDAGRGFSSQGRFLDCCIRSSFGNPSGRLLRRVDCSNSGSDSWEGSPEAAETSASKSVQVDSGNAQKSASSSLEPSNEPTRWFLKEAVLLLAGIILALCFWKVVLLEIRQYLGLAGSAFMVLGASLLLLFLQALQWLGNTFLHYGGQPAAWIVATAITAVTTTTHYAFFILDGLPIWETVLSLLSASTTLGIAEIASVPISRLGQPFLLSSLAAVAVITLGFSPTVFLSILLFLTLHLKVFRKETWLTSITPAVTVLVATASAPWFRASIFAIFLLLAFLSYKSETAGAQSLVDHCGRKSPAPVFQPFALRALCLILLVVVCRRVAYQHLLLWQL